MDNLQRSEEEWYKKLNNNEELKESIYEEIKSQFVNELSIFADRKIGIKDEDSIKNFIYEKQQTTVGIYKLMAAFSRQYESLDHFYYSEAGPIVDFIDIKMGQVAKEIIDKDDIDLTPDKAFLESIRKLATGIRESIRFILFRYQAIEILKDIKLNLYTVNLINHIMFSENGEESLDIENLRMFYIDFGNEIAELISEIFLRFIRLHNIRISKDLSRDDKAKKERELKQGINDRIFVYQQDEKEKLYNRFYKIIQLGYTVTEISNTIKMSNPMVVDNAREELVRVITNREYGRIIDGYLMEDLLTLSLYDNKNFSTKQSVIINFFQGYLDGIYDDRSLAVALLLFNPQNIKDIKLNQMELIFKAIKTKPQLIRIYVAYLKSLRDLLNRIWLEKTTVPYPIAKHLFESFSAMITFYANELQELADLSQLSEKTLNRVFVYKITRRPASIEPYKDKLKSFESVLHGKFLEWETLVPRSSIEKKCPQFLNSHFVDFNGIYMKIKPGSNYDDSAILKNLITYSQEDIRFWLQRTRLEKLSENEAMRNDFKDEIDELECLDATPYLEIEEL